MRINPEPHYTYSCIIGDATSVVRDIYDYSKNNDSLLFRLRGGKKVERFTKGFLEYFSGIQSQINRAYLEDGDIEKYHGIIHAIAFTALELKKSYSWILKKADLEWNDGVLGHHFQDTARLEDFVSE